MLRARQCAGGGHRRAGHARLPELELYGGAVRADRVRGPAGEQDAELGREIRAERQRSDDRLSGSSGRGDDGSARREPVA